MKILDRHIADSIARGTLIALGALTAVFSAITAIDELKHVGDGPYGMHDVLHFVLLTAPHEAYQLLPAATLARRDHRAGGLARDHELLAMAAAGVSRLRLLGSVLSVTAALAVGGMLLGEFVAAPLAARAHTARSIAVSAGLTITGADGLWTRIGSSFVNLRRLLPDAGAREVYVYEFDDAHRMRRFSYAPSATYDGHQWLLEGVVDNLISDAGVTTHEIATRPWDIDLSPPQLRALLIPPQELSLADLRRGMQAALRHGENPAALALAWWHRLTMPLVTLLMVSLAALFVLTSLRRATLGQLVAAGTVAGIGFQMVNQAFASFGLAYGLGPLLSALLPSGLVLAFGGWWLARGAS